MPQNKKTIPQTNIISEFVILVGMNKSIQVEGTFGLIKENHNFRKFLTRGKKKCKSRIYTFSSGL